MADDEDAIYIDVVPRVDDSAADSAVEKLKDKFKDVAKDVGPEFMDALGNSGVLEDLGTKLGEALSGPLKDLSEGTGLDLQNPLEKMLKQDMGGALDDVATQLGQKLGQAIKDPLRDAASSIGVDIDDAVSKALNKDWGGLAGSLGKGVGGKIGEALGLEDTLSGLDGVLGKAQDIGDVVKAFKSGGLSSGLSGAAGLFGHGNGPAANAGPLGDVSTFFGNVSALGDAVGHKGLSNTGSFLQGGSQILNNLVAPDAPDKSLGDSLGDILEHAGIGAGVGSMIPGLDATGIPEVIGALVGGGSAIAHNWDSIGHHMPWYHAPGSTAAAATPETGVLGGTGATPDFYAAYGPQSSSTSTTANEVEVQSNVATVSAGSVTLGGSISIPASMSGGSGTVHSSPAGGPGAAGTTGAVSPPAKSGGGGFLGNAGSGHFDQGGVVPGDSPGYDNAIGVLPNGSMVGLEGKEGIVRNRAMQQPGVAALITQLNKGFDEGTMSPAGVGGGVGGDSNNPSLSTTPTQPNTAGGNTPKQPQQFGSGQGGGISGGGIIGAAEQAGVAAAGVAGFGGGAIAAQMAVQETNLAVQKASQNAAALATAPFETFGLQGGQMGAPQVNPMGGWIGKLIGGALGQMNNLPNIAGASVQPPKQPQQKQPGDDQQGQGGGNTGPSGDRDDPMHVKVTNPQQPPPNAATSYMNMAPMTAGF